MLDFTILSSGNLRVSADAEAREALRDCSGYVGRSDLVRIDAYMACLRAARAEDNNDFGEAS